MTDRPERVNDASTRLGPQPRQSAMGSKLFKHDDDDYTQELQDVALLHTLATHPERVLAPGKTLRSALLGRKEQRKSDTGGPEFEKRVEAKVYKTMHKAFWDQVRGEYFYLAAIC